MTTQRVRSHSYSLIVSAAAAGALTLALPREARAFDPAPTGACYGSRPDWNAAKGMLVSASAPGIVAAALSILGESRTHVMISNGNGWATHSTTLQPSVNIAHVCAGLGWPCHDEPYTPIPLKPGELAAGSPGFTQINMGGAYAYWAGDAPSPVYTQLTPIPIRGADPNLCGARCKQIGVADWLWAEIPYETVPASGDYMYSLGDSDSGSFVHYSYGLHQYMDGVWRGFGVGSENQWFRGIQCAEVPPYAYYRWVHEYNPTIDPGSDWVAPHTYPLNDTINAGVAIWQSVYDQCMGNSLGFWAGLAISISGWGASADVKTNTCGNAAWQVLNCFAFGEDYSGAGCVSHDTAQWNAYWAQAYVTNPTATGAQSYSPESLMGLRSDDSYSWGSGPWFGMWQTLLQWSSGGNTYGCYY